MGMTAVKTKHGWNTAVSLTDEYLWNKGVNRQKRVEQQMSHFGFCVLCGKAFCLSVCSLTLALPGGVYKAQHQGPKNVLLPGSSGDSLEVVWPRTAPSFVRFPEGVMGMVHPGLPLLPMGDTFKLSNYH